MSLEIAHMNAARPKAERIPEGSYPSRLVSVVDLGIQPQTDWQTGEATESKARVLITWELPTETLEHVDDDGNSTFKPRRISKEYTLSNFERSNLMQLIKALSAGGESFSSLDEMLGAACMVNIGSTVNGNAKITGVMKAPKGLPVDDPSDTPVTFDYDNPSEAVYRSLVGWIQEKILDAENYTGFADEWS